MCHALMLNWGKYHTKIPNGVQANHAAWQKERMGDTVNQEHGTRPLTPAVDQTDEWLADLFLTMILLRVI